MRGTAIGCAMVVAMAVGAGAADEAGKAETANPKVKLTTNLGEITIELEQEKAPVTVENFLAYVRDGYYVGTVFHRVIPGFMIQGGGLDGTLRDKVEGQRPPIKNEGGNGLKNEVGTVAMARTSVPDSATSQFFINVKDNAFLDRAQAQDGVGYAVFGRVVDGMDVVRKIEGVKTGQQGMHRDVPVEPVTITAAVSLDSTSGSPQADAPKAGEQADVPAAKAADAAP